MKGRKVTCLGSCAQEGTRGRKLVLRVLRAQEGAGFLDIPGNKRKRMNLLSLTCDQLILSHPLSGRSLCLSSTYSSLPLGQSASLLYGTSTEIDSGPALAPQDSEAEPPPTPAGCSSAPGTEQAHINNGLICLSFPSNQHFFVGFHPRVCSRGQKM